MVKGSDAETKRTDLRPKRRLRSFIDRCSRPPRGQLLLFTTVAIYQEFDPSHSVGKIRISRICLVLQVTGISSALSPLLEPSLRSTRASVQRHEKVEILGMWQHVKAIESQVVSTAWTLQFSLVLLYRRPYGTTRGQPAVCLPHPLPLVSAFATFAKRLTNIPSLQLLLLLR
jgi:hypothetical protein